MELSSRPGVSPAGCIATTDDGVRHSGKGLNRVRRRNPAYTSQGCSACGHIAKANRPNQSTFPCASCGFAEHADVNAARNIAARGVTDRAAVSLPNAA